MSTFLIGKTNVNPAIFIFIKKMIDFYNQLYDNIAIDSFMKMRYGRRRIYGIILVHIYNSKARSTNEENNDTKNDWIFNARLFALIHLPRGGRLS